MPEGDTVWLAARRLDERLAGHPVTRSDFRVPALATATVTGSSVREVVARGKHLLFRFSDGRTLHTHFRMDGRWHLYRPGAVWRGGPSHQVRAVLGTEDWIAVGYRLPVVDLVPTAQEHALVGHLGPDLLGPDWDAVVALRNLRASPDREVGDALLDQRNLAGIGNIYRSEALFACGVSPYRPVGAVGDLEDLVATARRLLLRNAPRGTQSTTGDERRPHHVFERAGRACYRCGTTIRRSTLGEPRHERVTYWCPTCQP